MKRQGRPPVTECAVFLHTDSHSASICRKVVHAGTDHCRRAALRPCHRIGFFAIENQVVLTCDGTIFQNIPPLYRHRAIMHKWIKLHQMILNVLYLRIWSVKNDTLLNSITVKWRREREPLMLQYHFLFQLDIFTPPSYIPSQFRHTKNAGFAS